jgi:hypothetical protein
VSGPTRSRERTAIAVLAFAAVIWLATASAAFAATPTPSPVEGGDPRSSGQGPGLVGDPGFAILGVAVVAVVAIGGTLAYVRFTGGPGPQR